LHRQQLDAEFDRCAIILDFFCVEKAHGAGAEVCRAGPSTNWSLRDFDIGRPLGKGESELQHIIRPSCDVPWSIRKDRIC
jgi:hypothetical protein